MNRAADLLAALTAQVLPPDPAFARAARIRLDTLTKPPGSLGVLEDLAAQLAAISRTTRPQITRPVVLVAAADHGVVAEGVSAYPQAVTRQMVSNFLHGGAAINALAAAVGARVVIVDAGVLTPPPDLPGLVRAAARRGTRNLRTTAAMTEAEATLAILLGAGVVGQIAADGLDLLALGEMGIGNTTAAACLTCAFAGATPQQTVGRGTGVDDAGLQRKRAVVTAALARARPRAADPLHTLAELGGLEIALLAGAALAAAARRIPVLLDGYIATSAALAAAALAPDLVGSLIAGHRSSEPGHHIALTHLGLRPLLELEMRLGEGSGAALAIPLVRAAAHVISDMATFDEAGVAGRADD